MGRAWPRVSASGGWSCAIRPFPRLGSTPPSGDPTSSTSAPTPEPLQPNAGTYPAPSASKADESPIGADDAVSRPKSSYTRSTIYASANAQPHHICLLLRSAGPTPTTSTSKSTFGSKSHIKSQLRGSKSQCWACAERRAWWSRATSLWPRGESATGD